MNKEFIAEDKKRGIIYYNCLLFKRGAKKAGTLLHEAQHMYDHVVDNYFKQ